MSHLADLSESSPRPEIVISPTLDSHLSDLSSCKESHLSDESSPRRDVGKVIKSDRVDTIIDI